MGKILVSRGKRGTERVEKVANEEEKEKKKGHKKFRRPISNYRIRSKLCQNKNSSWD
jgi:hypothetical protein